MSTWVHKIKCMECMLHYAVYSWKENWEPGFCPECGARSSRYLLWKEESDRQIFEFIPGKTALAAMNVSDRL